MRLFTALSLSLGVGLLGCSSNGAAPTQQAANSAATAETRCSALHARQIAFGTVTEAAHVTEGEELMPAARLAMLRTFVPTLPDLFAPRDFCRVSAELRPVDGSLVKVQVWLPDEWNNKMLALGGGGFNGGLFSGPVAMHPGSALGYATVVSDVGHDTSESAKFAHDSREQFIDYGHRGNHVTAVFTKELINAYYGKSPTRAYFKGGSNGGREALMEARRYPQDYDGIIAGMPAMSFTRLMASFVWNTQVIGNTPNLKGKLKLVQAAVLDKCDALDGVRDEVIENPLSCKFDPAELQCKGAVGSDCLDADEVAALKNLYAGPRLRDGRQVIAGYPPGGEALPENWDAWIFNEKAIQRGMGEEAFRWMVHGDPNWDRTRFDLDRDFRLAQERAASILDADDPDLGEFIGRGGKLIIHHGWNDAAIPAGNTLDYYAALQQKFGPALERNVRLFMVPGMRHGVGRPGPDFYDMVGELDRWVEGAPAPERIVAIQYEPSQTWEVIDPAAKVIRTRPLCAWPKVAHYDGSGSTDDEANFTCK